MKENIKNQILESAKIKYKEIFESGVDWACTEVIFKVILYDSKRGTEEV